MMGVRSPDSAMLNIGSHYFVTGVCILDSVMFISVRITLWREYISSRLYFIKYRSHYFMTGVCIPESIMFTSAFFFMTGVYVFCYIGVSVISIHSLFRILLCLYNFNNLLHNNSTTRVLLVKLLWRHMRCVICLYVNSVVFFRDFRGCLYSGCMVSVFQVAYKPVRLGDYCYGIYILLLYILCACHYK